MVTFWPIHRQGRFVGVVTADLAMDYFRWLRNSVETLDLGPKTYCFVLSAGGRILAHRDDCFEFPNADSDAARIPADQSFCDLLARMSATPAGRPRPSTLAAAGRRRSVSPRFPRRVGPWCWSGRDARQAVTPLTPVPPTAGDPPDGHVGDGKL